MTENTKKWIDPDELKTSLVSPWLAALLSAIVPGLGQAFTRQWKRGLLLFASTLTIIGLLIWRFRLAAPRDSGVWNIVAKAFRLQPVLIVVSVLVGLLYLAIIYDAYKLAQIAGNPLKRRPFLVFTMLLLVFFSIGWQIGRIDPVSMFPIPNNAVRALGSVLWPWEKAIDFPEDIQKGVTLIESPCRDETFTQPEPLETGRYLLTDPICGDTSTVEGDVGTTFSVRGFGFDPGEEVVIWWTDPAGNEFRQRQGGENVKVMPDENGEFEIDIIMPYRLLPPSFDEDQNVWQLEGRQVAHVGEWEFSSELKLAVEKMVETIFIGMMATFFGIILSLPLSFMAAKNLMSANPLTLVLYYVVRSLMNIIRSIEPLIWAILFLIIVGLGPFAGILALTLHSAAALGKLYSEAIESIDPGPIEAVVATGANWFQVVAFAVVPQIIPPFVSFTIYRWDINIRMSTIIGMVGGGGIGFVLMQWIRLLDYKAAGIAVWFIAITVAVLDYVSSEIRERFV
jgi:phosphonate transport system permease protein